VGLGRFGYIVNTPVTGVRGLTHHPDILESMKIRPTSDAYEAPDASHFVFRFVFMNQRKMIFIRVSDMLKTILEPYIGTYKSIKHPCAAAAVSSKVIEKYDQFKKNHQREPTDEELNFINVCISHELNLNRNSADVLV